MISRRSGFTVIELMITVGIIAILATIAAPSLRDLVKNARMTSLVNDLMGDLSVARAEAVKRGVPVSVCTSNNGTSCTASEWRYGWIIFAESNTTGTPGVIDLGETILKAAPKINGADENPASLITSLNNPTAGTTNYVPFRPTGVTKPGGGGASIHFYLCDARRTGLVSAGEAINKGRHITLIGTGRAQTVRCTCDVTGLTCTP